jgi:hypothetical protein
VADSGSNAWGVGGSSNTGIGVYGSGPTGVRASGVTFGVNATGSSAVSGTGVQAYAGGYGVYASASAVDGIGLYAESTASSGNNSWGVVTHGIGGIYASSAGVGFYAGYFGGPVYVGGELRKSSGSFLIDHPLDPANKMLAHSFVESPDMLNVYSGTVTLDGRGRASVKLPRYFEALNRDFRYQLTAVGAPAPGLYVASKMNDGRFAIAGGEPGAEVCWQVTGIRQDAYAKKHPIRVERTKARKDKGRYLNPDAFGHKRSEAIGYLAPRRIAGPGTRGRKPSLGG